jgi:hypothetical protein
MIWVLPDQLSTLAGACCCGSTSKSLKSCHILAATLLVVLPSPAHRPAVHPGTSQLRSLPSGPVWLVGGTSIVLECLLVQGRFWGSVQSTPLKPAVGQRNLSMLRMYLLHAIIAILSCTSCASYDTMADALDSPPAGHSQVPVSALQLPTPLQSFGHVLLPLGAGLKGTAFCLWNLLHHVP